jgi:hypothetical protein
VERGFIMMHLLKINMGLIMLWAGSVGPYAQAELFCEKPTGPWVTHCYQHMTSQNELLNSCADQSNCMPVLENGEDCLLEIYCQGVPRSIPSNDQGIIKQEYTWDANDSTPKLRFIKKTRRIERVN